MSGEICLDATLFYKKRWENIEKEIHLIKFIEKIQKENFTKRLSIDNLLKKLILYSDEKE